MKNRKILKMLDELHKMESSLENKGLSFLSDELNRKLVGGRVKYDNTACNNGTCSSTNRSCVNGACTVHWWPTISNDTCENGACGFGAS
jgi:hypothetical protein